MGIVKRSVAARGWRVGGMNSWKTEDILGSDILYDTIMVDTCHYTYIQTIEHKTPRVNPNMNYELWVIIICQCRFTDSNKFTTLLRGVDNRGGYICVGIGDIKDISVPSSQFCCGPETALKNVFKCFFKKPRELILNT